MNREGRHEAAQRHLRDWLETRGNIVVSTSTTAPCDLISLHGISGSPTCWEVKTRQGRHASDLSDGERTFGRRVEAIGIPFVVARYRVVGDKVFAPGLFRPFGGVGGTEGTTAFLGAVR